MDMSKVPVPKGWADLPYDPTEGPHCWGWGWWLAFLTEDKDLASHPERVPTSNLDEGCLRAGLWLLHVHVLAPVTNYTMHLNGSRLVMMAFTLLRKGKKNGVRDGPFYGIAGTVPMEGGEVWPDAVKYWIIWAIHTYCFSVGRLPDDITIRVFPRQFSIPCLLKRNKELYIHRRGKH